LSEEEEKEKTLDGRILRPFPLFEKQFDKAGSKRDNSAVWGIHPDTFMQADQGGIPGPPVHFDPSLLR
jgi:hypothetical protein